MSQHCLVHPLRNLEPRLNSTLQRNACAALIPMPPADNIVGVLGHPDETALRVVLAACIVRYRLVGPGRLLPGLWVQLHLIGRDHALWHLVVAVHERHHLAACPLGQIGLAQDLVAHSKPKRVDFLLHVLRRSEAGIKALSQLDCIEVLADEDQLALARLVVPWLVKAPIERHVHGMVDKALPGVCDGEYALHTKDIFAAVVEQLADPFLWRGALWSRLTLETLASCLVGAALVLRSSATDRKGGDEQWWKAGPSSVVSLPGLALSARCRSKPWMLST
eukprot:scaffold30769_cov71-Phaeocystis_antarctica.AAC.7